LDSLIVLDICELSCFLYEQFMIYETVSSCVMY